MLLPLGVKVKVLNDLAKIPRYANKGDAGADLYSVDYGVLQPGERRLIGTGIALEIPYGWVGLVHPRSGLAAKLGISIVNAPGTVDSGYRGEIKVNLINLNSTSYTYCIGDRIAQILLQEVTTADFYEVEELDDSIRGLGGFGSTGGFNG